MPKKKNKLTARTADKHVLYQESVQAPDDDAHFFARYYKKYLGKPLRGKPNAGLAVFAVRSIQVPATTPKAVLGEALIEIRIDGVSRIEEHGLGIAIGQVTAGVCGSQIKLPLTDLFLHRCFCQLSSGTESNAHGPLRVG